MIGVSCLKGSGFRVQDINNEIVVLEIGNCGKKLNPRMMNGTEKNCKLRTVNGILHRSPDLTPEP